MVLTRNKLAREYISKLVCNKSRVAVSILTTLIPCGQGEHGEATGKPPGHDLSNLLVPGTASLYKQVLLVEKQTIKSLFRTELRNWRIRTH